MTEPTARKALLSLAEHFDREAEKAASGEATGTERRFASSVLRDAAQMAYDRARVLAGAANEPSGGSPGGGEADGDLSAARKRLLAAADTALDGLPQPENRFERDRWRIASRFVLDAVEPLIRADERERLLSPGPRCCNSHGRHCEPPGELCCENCTEADHPGHRRRGPCSVPDLSPNSLAEARKIAVAVQAERERIAALAEHHHVQYIRARIPGAPGAYAHFADLIRELP